MKSKGRFLELDALRGIAAIIVVIYHYIILDKLYAYLESTYIDIYQ